MEEQKRYTDRFLRTEKIEKHKKKSKLFFLSMPYSSAYLRESLDFFKVGILGEIQKFGFEQPTPSGHEPLMLRLRPVAPAFAGSAAPFAD